jgi:hypothetical protein
VFVFVLAFCGTGVWTQCLKLVSQELYHLSHSTSQPSFAYLSDRVHGRPQIKILLPKPFSSYDYMHAPLYPVPGLLK